MLIEHTQHSYFRCIRVVNIINMQRLYPRGSDVLAEYTNNVLLLIRRINANTNG